MLEISNYLLIETYESIYSEKQRLDFPSFHKRYQKIEKKTIMTIIITKGQKYISPLLPLIPPPLHRLNNVLNERTPFLKILGSSFFGSWILRSC